MLVHKPADDFAATLTARISAHQAAEAAREAARKKAAEEAARAAEAPRVTMTAAPAVVALPVQQAAAQPAEEATLSVGEIGRRLGFTLPSTFIESHLGVKARAQGAAKMYRASDFERICSALIQYVERVRSGERAAA